MTSSHTDPAAWWRAAVTYQVYPRSFADGDGDGVGDIAGIRSRLPYIRDLGVDAIWLNPWYPSPMADAGYDVADYRAIDPLFGTLAEAEALIAEARALDLRVLLDIVPNHLSSDACVVSGRARGGTRGPMSGSASCSDPDVAMARSRRTTGRASSVGPPGRASASPTGGPGSGTCTSSIPGSRT